MKKTVSAGNQNGMITKRKVIIHTSIFIFILCAYFMINASINQRKRERFTVIDDSLETVYQIDDFILDGNTINLKGYVFTNGQNSNEQEYSIVLCKYMGDTLIGKTNDDLDYLFFDTEKHTREDINMYYKCDFDYTRSGISANISRNKLNENQIYQILFKQEDSQDAIATSLYILDNNLLYSDPTRFKEINLKNIINQKLHNKIEEITTDGHILFYDADNEVYVYQCDMNVYWIMKNDYPFNSDNLTIMECLVLTTQPEKLPYARINAGLESDNLQYYFEDNELVFGHDAEYRITKLILPKEYSIYGMVIGHIINDEWLWSAQIRPWIEKK